MENHHLLVRNHFTRYRISPGCHGHITSCAFALQELGPILAKMHGAGAAPGGGGAAFPGTAGGGAGGGSRPVVEEVD